MMKRLTMWTILLCVWLLPVMAFAQEAGTQDSGNTIVSVLLGLLGTALVVVLSWLGRLVGKLLSGKIKDINNDLLQKAAYVAVRWVDDQYKSATGSEKFRSACENVAKKIPGVSVNDIEVAVAAMYKNYSAEMPTTE